MDTNFHLGVFLSLLYLTAEIQEKLTISNAFSSFLPFYSVLSFFFDMSAFQPNDEIVETMK